MLNLMDALDYRDLSLLVEKCKDHYKRFGKIKLRINDAECSELIDRLVRLCLEIPSIVIDSYRKPSILNEVQVTMENDTNKLLLLLLDQEQEDIWKSKLI
eukprot:NODE_765_length_4403_cov_0.417054.p4 type:complete len:100 gc:universal NODE_765_length_4403_cov_0.417054:3361-3660(+)